MVSLAPPEDEGKGEEGEEGGRAHPMTKRERREGGARPECAFFCLPFVFSFFLLLFFLLAVWDREDQGQDKGKSCKKMPPL